MKQSLWNSLHGFEKLSLCDWPGQASCVLFMGGCNLACPTCHNAAMAFTPQALPVLSRQAILPFITRRNNWLDGITLTGGEPTIHPALPALLADLKKTGLPVKLDTNGMRPDVTEAVLKAGLVSVVAVDVKGPWEHYPALTGGAVTHARARANLEKHFALARKAPHAFYFRTTQVPSLCDEDMDTVRSLIPAACLWKKQSYVVPGRDSNAATDTQTGRMSGNMVSKQNSNSHTQGPQSQRYQRPDPVQAACA